MEKKPKNTTKPAAKDSKKILKGSTKVGDTKLMIKIW